MHYAAEITSEQLHFPGEDAKLVNLLIDFGGQVGILTANIFFLVIQSCA